MFEYIDDGKLKTMKSDEFLSVFTQLPDNVMQETLTVNISGIKASETYLYTYDSKRNLLSKEKKAKGGYDIAIIITLKNCSDFFLFSSTILPLYKKIPHKREYFLT